MCSRKERHLRAAKMQLNSKLLQFFDRTACIICLMGMVQEEIKMDVPILCFHTKDGSGFVAAVKGELGIWTILNLAVAVSKYGSCCRIK